MTAGIYANFTKLFIINSLGSLAQARRTKLKELDRSLHTDKLNISSDHGKRSYIKQAKLWSSTTLGTNGSLFCRCCGHAIAQAFGSDRIIGKTAGRAGAVTDICKDRPQHTVVSQLCTLERVIIMSIG